MNLLLTHMKKEKAPRQLPRGFWLLFSVHAALRELLSYKISISIRKVEFWTVIKCDCLIFSTIQLF